MAHSISGDGREFRHQPDTASGRFNRVTARHSSEGTVAVYAFRHDGEVILVNLTAADARELGQWLVQKTEA